MTIIVVVIAVMCAFGPEVCLKFESAYAVFREESNGFVKIHGNKQKSIGKREKAPDFGKISNSNSWIPEAAADGEVPGVQVAAVASVSVRPDKGKFLHRGQQDLGTVFPEAEPGPEEAEENDPALQEGRLVEVVLRGGGGQEEEDPQLNLFDDGQERKFWDQEWQKKTRGGEQFRNEEVNLAPREKSLT